MNKNKTAAKVRALLSSLLALLLITSLYAQNASRTITGTVKDHNGAAIPGATVQVKNSQIVSATNTLGVFSLTIPANAKTLVITSIGMKPEEVSIGTSPVIEVTLEAAAQNLNEVVVIGYGTAKRANITSSISSRKCKRY